MKNVFLFIFVLSLFLNSFTFLAKAQGFPDQLLKLVQSEIENNPHSGGPIEYLRQSTGSYNFLSYLNKQEVAEIFGVSPQIIDAIYDSYNIQKPILLKNGMPLEGKYTAKQVEFRLPWLEASQLLKAAVDLQKMIPEGSTILFPGRSPIWVQKAFEFINEKTGKQYHSVRFNFSGYPDLERMKNVGWNAVFTNLVTPSRYEHFKKYLIASGLDVELPGPLYVVDYVEAGENLWGLIKILNQVYKDAKKDLPQIHLIDIHHPFISSPGKSPKVLTQGKNKYFQFPAGGPEAISYHSLNITNSGLIQIMIDFVPDCLSLGRYYPPYRWTPEFDQEREYVFEPAVATHEDLKLSWSQIWDQLGSRLFKYRNVFHSEVQNLDEIHSIEDEFIAEANLQDGFYGPGIKNDEVLFIVDISRGKDTKEDGQLNYEILPAHLINWIQSLSARKYQVVIFDRESQSLDYGIYPLFLQKPLWQKEVLGAISLDALTEEQKSKIRQIVIPHSSMFRLFNFANQVPAFLEKLPKLERIDYIPLSTQSQKEI